MSADPTPRNRRSSRRSNMTTDPSDFLSSSPPTTTGHAGSRQSLEPRPTTSSTESTSSDPFDAHISTPFRAASPITPPCETPSPSLENHTPGACLDAQSLDGLTPSKPTRRRNQVLADGTTAKSPKSADAPLRVSRRRPGARTSKLPVGQEPRLQALESHPTLADGAAHSQRASSAPTPRSNREMSCDLPIPGRYDSQSSDVGIDRNSYREQVVPSISLNDNRSAPHSALGSEKNDDEMDDQSYQPSDAGTSVQHEYCEDDIASLPESTFIPYKSQEGRPMVREVLGKRSANNNILDFILKDYEIFIRNLSEKNKNLGYVYIAKCIKHGPEILKIGKTKRIPDKRTREVQGGTKVNLEDISDKSQNPFYHYHFLEKVVHFELVDHRLKLKCVSHDGKVRWPAEWFEIDRERAFSVHEKWRNWLLIQKPFDRDGELTPYWHWRAVKLRASIADVNWEEWSKPPTWDYYVFRIEAHFDRGRKDVHFYVTSGVVALLSFFGHGVNGVFWACVALMLL